MYTVYDNIIPNINLEDLYTKLKLTPGWSFIGHSTTPNDGYTFWHLNLMNDMFFTKTVFNKICKLSNKNFTLLRCYANGQSYGQPGNFHIDGEHTYDYTFLIYINPVWDVKYGGATVFCKSKEGIDTYYEGTSKYEYSTFYPKPNTGLLFCGTTYHMALEPNRHFKDLRITVAYKLKEKCGINSVVE